MDIPTVALGAGIGFLAGLLLFGGIVLGYVRTQRQQRQRGQQKQQGTVDLRARRNGAERSDLQRVLAAATVGAVLVDSELRAVAANNLARQMDLVHDKVLTNGSIRKLCVSAQRSQTRQRIALEVPRRSNRAGTGFATMMLEVRAIPISNNRVVVLAEDRTAARQLDSIRRDFVANISHELKTPVGAISLLAETISDAARDPEAVTDFAERIGREANRLTLLVHEVIELSRAETAATLQHPRLVSVDALITDAVDQSTMNAHARDITLAMAADSGAQVRGDHDVLVTAVRNLLDNAVGHSPEGSRVAIGARIDSGMIDIAVVDHGPGIDPEHQPRIFERFYRIDPARSRETGGSGLGLSIVKHVAAEHGGEVTVWSKPGHGSTFTLQLPQAAEIEPDAPAFEATVEED